MVWVDRIVGDIKERFAEKIARRERLVIRDEKTLSGRVHVGSLRGIAIHGMLAQVLNEQNIANVFRFEFNDTDPMDEIPRTIERTTYEQHMGKPLHAVPALPGSDAPNYPLQFGNELQWVVKRLGFPLEFYTLKPEYDAGKFNDIIETALDHAAEIRAIYKEVSGSVKPDDWYPLQVVCERCGKVGTTQVMVWNPGTKTVTYECRKDLVTWARGCGHRGEISPFDGRAKLPWKIEWPAKWKVFGVDIEGAGKDHSAAGGSRDIGRRVSEEIFGYPEPFNIPYEFFNLGGKKMSASKGIGASAKEISDLLPPTLLRLLMIRKLPNQPIDFDPEGTTIPTLFDEYDRLADHSFKRHPNPDPDYARTFELCQLDFPKKPADLWHMRFSTLAFIIQMPHLTVEKEAEALKGSSLTENETKDLEERVFYVRQWIGKYAPDEYKFTMVQGPNDHFVTHPLSEKQIHALRELRDALEKTSWMGNEIHQSIHTIKEKRALPPKELFTPLYRMFLNRDNGPQIGWFLSTIPQKQVLSQIGVHLS